MDLADAIPPSSEEVVMASSASSEELELMTLAPVTPGGNGARGRCPEQGDTGEWGDRLHVIAL